MSFYDFIRYESQAAPVWAELTPNSAIEEFGVTRVANHSARHAPIRLRTWHPWLANPRGGWNSCRPQRLGGSLRLRLWPDRPLVPWTVGWLSRRLKLSPRRQPEVRPTSVNIEPIPSEKQNTENEKWKQMNNAVRFETKVKLEIMWNNVEVLVWKKEVFCGEHIYI